MAGGVLLVTQFLAAGLMLLLAGWLLYLNFHSRVTRAFSLFLLLRAMNILSNQFARVLDAPFDADYWLGVRGYYDLAVVPALAYFLLVYARPQDASLLRWGGWGLLAATLAVELAYLADHCVALCRVDGLLQVGPLGVVMFAAVVAYAAIGLVLGLQAARHASSHAKSAAFLVSVAFFLHAVFEVSLALAAAFSAGVQASLDEVFAGNAWQRVPFLTFLAAVVLLLATLAVYVLRPVAVRRAHAWLVLALAALEVGVAILLDRAENPGVIVGLVRMAFPLLVVLAILRHRLFGVNVRIRTGISRGTVAGIIIAAFFAVNKIVENLVAEGFGDGNVGIYVGGTVAGLLLFAISPLQKLGERVAGAAAPTPVEDRASRAERLRFYRDQAEIAWSDGILGRRERRLLDQLRERLQLSAEDAAAIEGELVRPAHRAAKRKPEAALPG